MLREPDFIIAGATLGGTRALMNILYAHPQISIPQLGEPLYFAPGKPVTRILRPLSEAFEDAAIIRHKNALPPRRILIGEEEYSPTRAHEGAPYAKVIFTLRNPVMRAFMQYHNAKAKGRESAKTFEIALEAELEGQRTPDNSALCWIYKNQYQKHLHEWLSLYPRRHLCITICEEWSNGLQRGLNGLEGFLGLAENSLSLDNAYGFRGREAHKAHEKLLPKVMDYPPLSEKTQQQLEDIFALDINYVENFLGRKILSWS